MVLQDMPPMAQFNTNLLIDARHAATRAEALTKQLLAFSRQQVIQPCVLHLDMVVTDTQRMLARLIGEDIHLVTTFDAATPAVKADPGQMAQIILNLAINAREAMPNGGTLAIRTHAQVDLDAIVKSGSAHVIGPTPAAWAVLEVSDTGVGMNDATRTRIFEPFFTTRGDGSGVGLGLSVVYGIVSQSGGHIQVSSDVGKGTTFQIFLPGCQEPAAVPGILNDAPIRKPGTETILVVEDEDSVRSLVREVLSKAGYTVVGASNGEDALCWMESEGDNQNVDLIISDVIMPKMGGRELVRELSRRGFEIPVLFMSGYTNDPSPLEDMLGDRASFLPKPFTIDGLYDIVRRTLNANGRATVTGH
jgi:CheY-like chemotaxis protein